MKKVMESSGGWRSMTRIMATKIQPLALASDEPRSVQKANSHQFAGRPLAVKVEESSGHTVLDEAAVAAVRDWDFLPTPSDQFALTAAVEVPIRFFLSNAPAN